MYKLMRYVNITNEGLYVKNSLLKEEFYKFKDVSTVYAKSMGNITKDRRGSLIFHYSYEYLIELSNRKIINVSKDISNSDFPNLAKVHRILIDEYNTGHSIIALNALS